jgi:hypothetical protein
MTLDKNQMMVIATWFNVYENETQPSAYEYELMTKICLTLGNTLGAEENWRKHLSALEYERIAEAEWQAEEAECYDAFGVNTKNSFNTPPKPN